MGYTGRRAGRYPDDRAARADRAGATSRSSTGRAPRSSATRIFCLGLLRDGEGPTRSRTMSPGRSRMRKVSGVKVINAGGCAAFKSNARSFSLDDVVPAYGVTSRAIAASPATGGHGARRAASAPRPLQQSRPRRQRRDRAGDDRGGRRPADAPRALQFYGYGSEGERHLLRRGAAGRARQRYTRTSPSMSAR